MLVFGVGLHGEALLGSEVYERFYDAESVKMIIEWDSTI